MFEWLIGTSFVGEGDSAASTVTLRSASDLFKVGGSFCILHSSHPELRKTVFRLCNPTLINTALRTMLQPQVGARYSHYSLVLVRRLLFVKDYISLQWRPFHSLGLYYLTRYYSNNGICSAFEKITIKIHVVQTGTIRLVRPFALFLAMKLSFFWFAFRFSHFSFAYLDDYSQGVDSLGRPSVQCCPWLLSQVGLVTAR